MPQTPQELTNNFVAAILDSVSTIIKLMLSIEKVNHEYPLYTIIITLLVSSCKFLLSIACLFVSVQPRLVRRLVSETVAPLRLKAVKRSASAIVSSITCMYM